MTEAEAIAKIESAYALEMARGGELSRIIRQSPLLAPLIKNVWMSGYGIGYQGGLAFAAAKLDAFQPALDVMSGKVKP